MKESGRWAGRVTPSTVIAVIALAVALIGMPTAYAVGTGTIKTRMLAKGAVTAIKLAKNAVTADKVAPSAITGAKIADGSVGFGDLAKGTTIATIAVSAPGVIYDIANQATLSIPLTKNSWVQQPGEMDMLMVEYDATADQATTAYVGVDVYDAGEVHYVGGGQGSHDYSTTWNTRRLPSFEYEAQAGSATPWVGTSDSARTLHVKFVLREDNTGVNSAIHVQNVKVYVLRLR